MSLNNNIQLRKQLTKLGFDVIIDEVDKNIMDCNQNFFVVHSNKIEDNSLLYVLQFKKEVNKIKLEGYGLTMQSVVIPKENINGIDTGELETRMIKADDLYNDYYISAKSNTDDNNKIIEYANKDLHSLVESGGTGREIAQLLMFKYWPESNYKELIPHAEKLKENYQVEMQVGYDNENF